MADEVRLIDGNALKERLKKLKAKADNKKYEQGLQDAIDGYFPMIIDDAPTIEATPCTFCIYNPPSSGDGKPCTMCPAVAKGE